jgi:hypothetical protein
MMGCFLSHTTHTHTPASPNAHHLHLTPHLNFITTTMAITTAVSDLFSSFYELIASIFGAAYSLVHGLVSVIVGFFSGVVNLILGFIRETLHAAGSSGKFVLHNADKGIWILVGVAAAVAVARFTATGQRTAANNKRTQ